MKPTINRDLNSAKMTFRQDLEFLTSISCEWLRGQIVLYFWSKFWFYIERVTKLSRGQARGWHKHMGTRTHRRAQAMAILEGQSWSRVRTKVFSFRRCKYDLLRQWAPSIRSQEVPEPCHWVLSERVALNVDRRSDRTVSETNDNKGSSRNIKPISRACEILGLVWYKMPYN